jgi:hypothetical protein
MMVLATLLERRAGCSPQASARPVTSRSPYLSYSHLLDNCSWSWRRS